MNLSDVGNLISKSAPLLGLALGGPVGAAAGEAASLIATLFGADPQNAQDIANKINSDPQAAQKLAELQAANLDRSIQLNQMHYSDIANARDREIELAKASVAAGQKIDNTPRILAIMYTVGYLLAMAASIASRVIFPQLNFDTATASIGNGEMFILGYYFGSSNRDRIK